MEDMKGLGQIWKQPKNWKPDNQCKVAWIVFAIVWLILLFVSAITDKARGQEFGEFIGHVPASDPDSCTILTYTILQGNRDDALSFGDPRMLGPDHTGDMYIKNPEAVRKYQVFILVIRVQDNGIPGQPVPQLYCRARVRFKYRYAFVVEPLTN